MMSRILKKLKTLLKQIGQGRHSISYFPYEKPNLYPYRFLSRAAKKAHERQTALNMSFHMYY